MEKSMGLWKWAGLTVCALLLSGCGIDCGPVEKNRWLMECSASDPFSRWGARRMLRSMGDELPPGQWLMRVKGAEFALKSGSVLHVERILADGDSERMDLILQPQEDWMVLQGSGRLLPWLLEELDELRRLRVDMRDLRFDGPPPSEEEEGSFELVYKPLEAGPPAAADES